MPTSPQVAEAVAGTGGAARPRFMVPVDGRRASAGVIRETSRIAQAQGAPWLAVYLDASRRLHYSRLEERRLSANLRLVDQLGGDLVCFLPSERYLGRDLLALAKARGVTHLVLGHSDRPRWLDRLRGSLLEELARGEQGLVIHAVPPRADRAAGGDSLQTFDPARYSVQSLARQSSRTLRRQYDAAIQHPNWERPLRFDTPS